MSDSRPTSNETDRPGVAAAFPYDRMTVERFRKTFPRARWNDDLKAWLVPGKTAARRFDRWLEREHSQTETHADTKGRDAFVFDPIASKYLRRLDSHLEVVTPYSRTVVDEMRQVPLPPGTPIVVCGRSPTGHMRPRAGTGFASRRLPSEMSRTSAKSAEKPIVGRKKNGPHVRARPNAAGAAIRSIRRTCRPLVGR
jgi:hypothetical protein